MQAARGASLNSGDDETPQPADTDHTTGGADGTPAEAAAAEGVVEPRRRPAVFVAVALLVYVLDQLTKVWAVRTLEGADPIRVIPGVLDLRFLRNPGAAFGMATGFTWLLSLLACGVVVAVALMAPRLRDRVWAVALGLLLAGAVGNLTDRLLRAPGFLRGHVVDFLELPSWPVFNVADMALTTACALIVVQSFRGVGLDGRRDAGGRSAR